MDIVRDILLVLAFALGTSLAAHRLRVPNLVGFIVAGSIIGPYGLKLIHSVHEVEVLAELGVVLLLFTIGLEFSPAHLRRLRRVALLGGPAQIALTVLLAGGLFYLFVSPNPPKAILVGSMAALSSTAIVLTLLQQRGELESPHGQISLGILIFQDLAIVPLMLLIPFLAGKNSADPQALGLVALKSFLVLAMVYALGRWGAPLFIEQVARTRSRELFVLAVITFCLAVAWVTYRAGLSLSLGAFLAGFILARSEYNYQAVANILPFKDFLTCFFFISIGMLFEPASVLQTPGHILGLAGLIFLLKGFIIYFVVRALGYPSHTALLVGTNLFQIGEFSFVLAQEALKLDFLGPSEYQLMIAVTILTMLLTPLVIALAQRWPRKGASLVRERRGPEDHLIIVGFGLIGRTLRAAAKKAGIPYVIVEMNPETVKREKVRGEPIVFGDASYESILHEAGLEKARVMAVTIPDYQAARRIVALARGLNPDLHLIVRTRYVAEILPLLRLGANEVVPEELVAAFEIFARTLRLYLLTEAEIQGLLRDLEQENYQLFCHPGFDGSCPEGSKLHET